MRSVREAKQSSVCHSAQSQNACSVSADQPLDRPMGGSSSWRMKSRDSRNISATLRAAPPPMRSLPPLTTLGMTPLERSLASRTMLPGRKT